jgi:hypothetical protein
MPSNSESHFTANGNTRERGNYYSLLNMSKRIIHLAGLDGRDGDTILSVAACLNYTGETEAVISLAKTRRQNVHSFDAKGYRSKRQPEGG